MIIDHVYISGKVIMKTKQ